MATEILINDGGAPARILPYEAAEAITAGSACTVDVNGKLQLADTGDAAAKFAYVGIALVDAAAGDLVSLITGVGVVLNINCANVNAGIIMMMGAATPGQLITATNGAGAPKAQCVTLENTGAGLTKCQTL
jgi:hypothetical protein|tara:strand:+ start:2266 stop:2658 length:393 start_codon:yes stop_codon:yes gene_type:complete